MRPRDPPGGRPDPTEPARRSRRPHESCSRSWGTSGHPRRSRWEAGVDPALVSHFYGKKRTLFLAVVELGGTVGDHRPVSTAKANPAGLRLGDIHHRGAGRRSPAPAHDRHGARGHGRAGSREAASDPWRKIACAHRRGTAPPMPTTVPRWSCHRSTVSPWRATSSASNRSPPISERTTRRRPRRIAQRYLLGELAPDTP